MTSIIQYPSITKLFIITIAYITIAYPFRVTFFLKILMFLSQSLPHATAITDHCYSGLATCCFHRLLSVTGTLLSQAVLFCDILQFAHAYMALRVFAIQGRCCFRFARLRPLLPIIRNAFLLSLFGNCSFSIPHPQRSIYISLYNIFNQIT